eukprot:COSAG02_NODE_57781_length_279_cov_0.950000_1_plen_82_part_10
MSEQVAEASASASSHVSEVATRLESELADVSATSAALESTVASLRTEQSATSASIEVFNDTATTEIYTNLNSLALHDALPI